MATDTSTLRGLLSLNRLSQEDQRELSDAINEIDIAQAALTEKIYALHQRFIVRQNPLDLAQLGLSQLDLKNPEHVALALHKAPELGVTGEADINRCHWWSILALCEQHPHILAPRVDVNALRLAMAPILSERNKRGYLKQASALATAFKIKSRFKKIGITL